MPNHVHVIVVPGDPDGLRATFANAHRRYAPVHQCPQPLDGAFVAGPVRRGGDGRGPSRARGALCRLNPVRARWCERAEDWPWSSERRISPGGTTSWSGSRRCSIGSATSPPSSERSRTSRRRVPCGWPRRRDVRWETILGGGLEERTGRVLAAQKRGAERDRKIGYCHRNPSGYGRGCYRESWAETEGRTRQREAEEMDRVMAMTVIAMPTAKFRTRPAGIAVWTKK